MSWHRLDDDFDDNDKQLALSDAAFRLWVCSWSFCARQRPKTGCMTEAQALALARKLGKTAKTIRELVDAGRWERTDDGYAVHDFGEHVEKGSQERVAKHRANKGNGNGAVTAEKRVGNVTSASDVTEGAVTETFLARDGSPVPEPVPVPPGTTGLRPSVPSPHSVRGVTSAADSADSAESAQDSLAEQSDALCNRMRQLVSERAKPPAITVAWRHDARLLLSRDHRPLDEALELMAWAAENTFWRRNVMGIPKFREQYDRLLMQMRDEGGGLGAGNGVGAAGERLTHNSHLARQIEALQRQQAGGLQ